MYQEERLKKIMELLQDKESLSYKDIMDTFQISRDSARRDIIKLTQNNHVLRTHGGIMLNNHSIFDYEKRLAMNHEIKLNLAKHASLYLKLQQIAYFDVSTTIYELCQFVHKPLIAYTNSITNLERLSQHVSSHMLPGEFQIRNRFVFGAQTILALENLHFDIAFLGVASMNENGIFFEDEEDALIKQKVCKQSEINVVIYDHSKYDKQGHFKGMNFKDIQIIVTDKMPPKPILNQIKKHHIALEMIGEEQ